MLDDSYVDDVLGDGIHGQDLVDNDCYKEIQSHIDLKVAAQNVALETVSTEEAIRVLIRDNVTLSDKTKKRLQDYQVEESFSTSNWIFSVEEMNRVSWIFRWTWIIGLQLGRDFRWKLTWIFCQDCYSNGWRRWNILYWMSIVSVTSSFGALNLKDVWKNCLALIDICWSIFYDLSVAWDRWHRSARAWLRRGLWLRSRSRVSGWRAPFILPVNTIERDF